jgi:hypothetical protein
MVLGASAGRGQPAPCPPTPCVPDECPKVCLPKAFCSGLFHKPAHAGVPCEKTVTAPAPKITVLVPPPEIVVRTVPAPAATSAPVAAKCPHCAKAAAAPRVSLPVAAPAPVYAAPAPVYAAPAPVYAAPPPVLVPQVSYQMVPTVSMQAVPTMTYGVAPMAPCAPPPVGVGSCAQPQGNNVGSCAPPGGSNVGSGPGQRFGSTARDLDAEIDRLANEIQELGKRVLTNSQKQKELEEKLKKNPDLRKLLEAN